MTTKKSVKRKITDTVFQAIKDTLRVAPDIGHVARRDYATIVLTLESGTYRIDISEERRLS